MQRFKIYQLTCVFLLVLLPGFALGGNDSLEVKIVNTTQDVSSMRFIERDSSNVILRVIDEWGEAFRELKPEQVEIWRGQKQAEILSVKPLEATLEKSVYVVLALDNSASMNNSRKELLFSVQQLFQMLKGKSEFSIALFDEQDYRPKADAVEIDGKKINVVTYDFSPDLDAQLENIRWNYDNELTSRTYLNDEIIAALRQIQKVPKNRLRLVIVLSDGRDLGSHFDFDRVLEEAKQIGVTVYGIDYSRLPKIESNIKRLTEATPQGKAYKAKNASDLIPVFEALTREIINEFQVTYHFSVPPSGEVTCTSDSLTIMTRQITDEFPMLNYVFFDSNSAIIDSRYLTFESPEVARDFDETQIRKSLEKYYHLLNVIGRRAQRTPSAKLTLTGCNMNVGAEKNNLDLSRQRAEAVSQYLQEIWGIAPERITVQKRNLPQKPSSTRTPAGQAENRRVEITATEPALLFPIRSEITESVYQPEIGVFRVALHVPEGLKEWTFTAAAGGEILLRKTFGEPKAEINWNWLNTRGEKISRLDQINYSLEIRDDDAQSVTTAPKILPIREIKASNPLMEVQADTVYQKFSLILFAFNSSKLSGANQVLMGKVLNLYHAHPDAKMQVFGYCDDIGSEAYNLKLSTQRAKMAYNSLKRMKIPADQLSYLGYGEINPIFSNATPEGRFLNRTVQILISYPRGEVAEK